MLGIWQKKMIAEKVIMKRVKGSHIRAQSGAGLIEILITLFILAVGLLGVAALQFTGSLPHLVAVFFYAFVYWKFNKLRMDNNTFRTGYFNMNRLHGSALR